MVFRVLAELCELYAVADADYVRGCLWCAQALENQFVYFPPPIGKDRTREELSSGAGWKVTRPTEMGPIACCKDCFRGCEGPVSSIQY